ncbi:MAG: pyruvate, phosphate dikinase [Candidatus Lernaella stagnicola]|nr:pyruvate, phosphate dikinase [Candidatus Lernaella stagnicola]
MATKYVYSFGDGKAEGNTKMKNLLGGKGANLAEMSSIGVPVPAGFTITTEVCTYYYQNKDTYPQSLEADVAKAIKRIERAMGRTFGNTADPLLLSVRSGARESMPGMMDTVLNLGLNDQTVQGLAATGNERFAWDSYRRFVQMYGDVVLDMKPREKTDINPFEEILEEVKKKRKIELDIDLTVDDLKLLVKKFKAAIKKHRGIIFPEDPHEQLWGAIGAVFGSWNNQRAIHYRRMNKIPDEWGTAVNVQSMVFGNMGDDSATGVAFTRNPANGDNEFYGEWLLNAQGEDVVAGTRTPQPIVTLKKEMPVAYRQLMDIRAKLEKHYKDMQDVEFTIQQGKLWMLQTRTGKRTGFADCIIAVDMVRERLITQKTAICRVNPNSLNQLLAPIFDDKAKNVAIKNGALLTKGLPAGPGAATGRIAFHADDAADMAKDGEPVILVRIETSPEDIKGMEAAKGILTARGGMTSHAALVARQMGRVCVAGCGALEIDYKKGSMKVGGQAFKEGDFISLDGTVGEVLAGQIAVSPSKVKVALFGKGAAKTAARRDRVFQAYELLMKWADKFRTMEVWTNADQPDQAAEAIVYGAQGIGLCRTEHMFFGGDRIVAVREMILADDTAGREKALKKLLPIQRRDFIGIFKAMGARPVTIRLLDPPLHEFLPHTKKEVEEVAKVMGVSPKKVVAKTESLSETNPMLGHRGCRLGVSYPEIYRMQVRAIAEAAVQVKTKNGVKVKPEIMIPLVGTWKELQLLRREAEEVIAEVMAKKKAKVKILIGTMIELPRAALTAGEIAQVADFFSFGTNDLTQTTFGLSRDDAGKFLPEYVDKGILPEDPFIAVDKTGVGRLMSIGATEGRAANPKLQVGICGEHGGEPSSVKFCHEIGLNYVSCSPPRVPIARLAAAQAALES